MKKLNEIINTCIKCVNKQTTKELQELQGNANKLLFHYSNRFINGAIRDKLLKEFKSIGQETNLLNVTPKAEAKKQEILQQMRDIFKALNQYQPDLHQYNYCGSKTLKWVLSTYLHYKEQGLDPATAIAILNNIKETRNEWAKCTVPPALVNANKELLGYLSQEYKLE